ncbi:hypothetical protein DW169_00525 [Bacteroides intestinalis]|nr:hypothetical protein DW169_00525 [Bacteroides intestinalis]
MYRIYLRERNKNKKIDIKQERNRGGQIESNIFTINLCFSTDYYHQAEKRQGDIFNDKGNGPIE